MKLLIWIIALFLLAFSVNAFDNEVPGTFWHGEGSSGVCWSTQDIYQQFSGDGGTLNTFTFKVFNYAGSPTGLAYFELWSSTGEVPDAYLANFTTLDTSTMAAGGVYNVSLVLDEYQTVAGTNYTFVAHCPTLAGPNYFSFSGASGYTMGKQGVGDGSYGSWTADGWDIDLYFDTYWNGTTDTSPPEITFYNMTSEGGEGCTEWNTSKNNACATSDTTPTVFIRTNEVTNCSIGNADLNYTDLGGNRTCSGNFTNEHTCTLIPNDELTEEISYIYIGCRNVEGLENLSSTSGALKLSLLSSGLENTGRNSIETGIQHALPTGYTIYTDQRIYARNSANQQIVGVFDKVAKWMNKIWAFNIITGNETLVGMFNITPVLYTLEINTTTVSVNNTVYQFIMDTK